MESYSIEAILSVSDKNFTKKMNAASSSLADFEGKAKKSEKGLLSFASAFAVADKAVSALANTMSDSLSRAVDRVDTLNRYPKLMKQMGYSSEESEESIRKLSDGIEGLPTALNEIVSSAQGITLITGNLRDATDTAIALNDAFYASGASSADASRGMVQYTQMLSSGKVDMQSWRTLLETMGYALTEVAYSFGYAGESAKNDLYAALQSGEITFSELNARIVELDTATGGFAEVARTASGGIKTSMQNLGTAVVKGMANTINAIDTALEENGLPKFQEQIEGAKDGVNATFSAIESGSETVISIAAPAINLLANNMNVLLSVLGPVAAGYGALKIISVVSAAHQKFVEDGTKAANTLKAIRDASSLAAEASNRQKTALEAARAAEMLNTSALEAERKALEARTQASRLDSQAKKAEEAAAKAAQSATQASEQAVKKEAAAKDAAKRAADKLASAEKESASASKKLESAMKAQEAATNKAARAEEAKAKASKKASEAQDKSTKASSLSTEAANAAARAAKLEAEAEKKKKTAKMASEVADRAATEASKASAAATTAETLASEASSGAIVVKNALLSVLAGKMSIATAAQIAWNAAMTANPIGTIITLASTLVGVLWGVGTALNNMGVFEDTVYSRTEKLSDETDELIASMKESSETYEDTVKEIENTESAIYALVDSVSKLSSKQGKSSGEVAELQGYVEDLNSSMEDLNLTYDEEADKLSMSTDLLKAKADAYNSQKEGEAHAQRYTELLTELADVENQLAEVQAEYTATQDEMNQAMVTSGNAALSYAVPLGDLEDQINTLQEKQKDYASEIDEVSDQMAASYQKRADAQATVLALEEQALADSIANQTLSLDQLSEANQETVQTLQGVWQEYTGAATEMFDRLSDDITLSAQDMIDNIQHNQEVVSAWGDNMQSLRDRFSGLGLDSAILDQLSDLGIEGAGYVAALVTASDEQLNTLATEFSEGGEVAKKSLFQSLGTPGDEVPEAVKKLVTQTQDSLSEAVAQADWSSLGESMMTGTAQGAADSAGLVSDQVSLGMIKAREAAGEAVGEGSPATSFIELGNNMNDGLVIGINDNGDVLSAAEKSASAIPNEFSDLQSEMESIGSYAMTGLNNGMISKRPAVLSTAYSIASAIAETMEDALDIGSPSKITTKIGEWAGIGPAIGLENMLPRIEKASDKVAQAMVPAKITDLHGITMKYAYQLDAAPRGSSGMGGSYEISSLLKDLKDVLLSDGGKTYHIDVTSELDGREIAKASAVYTQEELEKLEKKNKRKGGVR